MKFRYLFDPLFLVCFGIYIVNRCVLEVWMPYSFFTDYVNDLLCIPFCVPIMLFIMRTLRLRADDSPPRSHEILVPLVLWSWAFEVWLPTLEAFRGLAVPDHRDVFCYTVGALVAGVVWKLQYSAPATQQT